MIHIDPGYADLRARLYAAHVNFGNALLAQGKTAAALLEFQTALAVNPQGAEALAAVRNLQQSPATVTPTAVPDPQKPRPVVHVLAPGTAPRSASASGSPSSALSAGAVPLASAELWVDGGQTAAATAKNPAATETEWNLALTWTSYVLGNHSVVVRVIDRDGGYGDSLPVRVVIIPNVRNPQVWLTGAG